MGLLGNGAELVSREGRAAKADRQGLFMCFLFVKGPFQVTQSTINLNRISTLTGKKWVRKFARGEPIHLYSVHWQGTPGDTRGSNSSKPARSLQSSLCWPGQPGPFPYSSLTAFPHSRQWAPSWATTAKLTHSLCALMYLLCGWHEHES